jgi:DNA polymerase III subunit delta'
MAFSPADILERLRRARRHGRLPHAMLLTGTPGSGRSRLAVEIAALANDITPEEAEGHPDIHKLEPGSKSRRILVAPFHQFCEPFFSTSFRAGATKTGIILDADRLHTNAANAFLKTLEEPPENTLFILVTSNPGLLPVTIVSRCAHFPVRSAALPDLDGPAAEVAAATGEVLSAGTGRRAGAALRLARRLQSLLRASREDVEKELTAAFKAEKKRLGDTADEEWLKDEEARLKALVEARVLGIRQHLIGIVAERTADVIRALQFPVLAEESRRLAGQFGDADLLSVLDGAARLRLFLDRNVKEDIALEAGCLALARS